MPKHNGSSQNDPLTIAAMPTKALFIDMLTRDIALVPAIVDLVDNCVDGARRIRPNRSFQGLWARLELDSTRFRIADNCGGIPVDTARRYAFRFGRAAGAPSVKHSVGQFGVGMKRAIFKLGRQFRVESSTDRSRFVVEETVQAWARKKEWSFSFHDLDERRKVSAHRIGTTITVTQLQPDVAESFRLAQFLTELQGELRARLRDALARGLAITVNKLPLEAHPLEFLSAKQLTPAFREFHIPQHGRDVVTVKLYCGLGPSQNRETAGWNIFCNGRLILQGDKTGVTGWGEENSGIRIPGFHGQYNHLHGFAYFDCDDPSKLPWNTTKTGVDTDSPVYRVAKLEMMKLMLPVKTFLDQLKKEKEAMGDEDGPLQQLVSGATARAIEKVSTRKAFVPPMVVAPSELGPRMQRIQYDRPYDDVQKARRVLRAKSFKEVGEMTFDYYFDAEVES